MLEFRLKSRSTTKPISTALTVGIWLLVIAKVGIHLATCNRYGIFRDELYYVACARHLAWGYVDQPPLIAITTWAILHTIGSSLFALRLLPALAGGAIVWLAAACARELGGGEFSQLMAGFAIIPVPIYLIVNHWLTMNAFEPLFWTAILWLSIRMVNRQDPTYWVRIGTLVGLSLENKYSIVFLVFALLIGLVISDQRHMLKTCWLVVGALLAGLLFLPNLLWLIQNHFPFLEFERNSRLSATRLSRPPWEFFTDQLKIMNPFVSVLWLGGICWALRAREAVRFRYLGWLGAVFLLSLMVLRAKNYYVTPIYPAFIAAGTVMFERLTASLSRGWRVAFMGATAASGLLIAPLVMPILSVSHFLAYRNRLGGFQPVEFERLRPSVLPQYFSDEIGWEEMARTTASIYHALPPDQQKVTAVFGSNYGEAAAIDFFAANYALPPAISDSETYWLWGPRQYSGESVIVLGGREAELQHHFAAVRKVAIAENPLTRPEERFSYFLCTKPTSNLRTIWPTLRNW